MKSEAKTPRTNWALIIISILIAYGLLLLPTFKDFILNLGEWSYFGIFISGILFVFTSTVATAVIVFHRFGEIIPPWTIGLIAGLGAVVGDYLIFMFIRKHIAGHTRSLAKKIHKSTWFKVVKVKHVEWVLPLAGVIIVALPFPDEVGMALLGISKIKPHQFVILAFILHTITITLIAMTGQVIQ